MISSLVKQLLEEETAYSGFMSNVLDFFKQNNSKLITPRGRFAVHSIRYRMKSERSIKDKIERKVGLGKTVTPDNIHDEITDFCGVRALHLSMEDFRSIHEAIKAHVGSGHWVFHENPKAYTWDFEVESVFKGLGMECERKESFYTSAHYLVKPNNDSFVKCEIQVRNLFEEIWGEVDHEINYPTKNSSESCQAQIKVLARLVAAGSRLTESIYSSTASGGGASPRSGPRKPRNPRRDTTR